MAETEYSDRFARVVLGTNEFVDARALVHLDGEDQMHLERGSTDGQLLLTTDIYAPDGTHIAKLRRNAWAFHDDDYEITTSPTNLTLAENSSGRHLFVARVTDQDTIVVDNADFYGARGSHVVVTPEAVKINDTITLAGNSMMGTNGIVVGPMGFAM